MKMISSKNQIIEYFQSGIKDTKNFKIGIEHEKFLFSNNKRINYLKIKEMFAALLEFGWNPIYEKDNIVALNKESKSNPQSSYEAKFSIYWTLAFYLLKKELNVTLLVL